VLVLPAFCEKRFTGRPVLLFCTEFNYVLAENMPYQDRFPAIFVGRYALFVLLSQVFSRPIRYRLFCYTLLLSFAENYRLMLLRLED